VSLIEALYLDSFNSQKDLLMVFQNRLIHFWNFSKLLLYHLLKPVLNILILVKIKFVIIPFIPTAA